MLKRLTVRTSSRTQFVDITSEIVKFIEESKVRNGICVVFVPHTTVGITINENADPSVRQDIMNTLNKLVPPSAGYTHLEGNADSHIKASLVGSSVTLIIENGRPLLGTWQGIYFCEFDGPRTRSVYVKIVEG
jgi:secondary thiamine-phosphate synthase enzyme